MKRPGINHVGHESGQESALASVSVWIAARFAGLSLARAATCATTAGRSASGSAAKAFADVDGNDQKAMARYIKLRVAELREELQRRAEQEDAARCADKERQRAEVRRQEEIRRQKEELLRKEDLPA